MVWHQPSAVPAIALLTTTHNGVKPSTQKRAAENAYKPLPFTRVQALNKLPIP